MEKQEHKYYNCPAFLNRNTRRCGYCYYVNNIDDKNDAYILDKYKIDMRSDLKVLLTSQQASELFADVYYYVLIICERCEIELYIDTQDNYRGDDYETFEGENGGNVCIPCYEVIKDEIIEKFWCDVMENGILDLKEYLNND